VAADDCVPLEFTTGSFAAIESRLHAVLPRLMESYELPGAALALIEQGRVRDVRWFGMAQPGAGVPVTRKNAE